MYIIHNDQIDRFTFNCGRSGYALLYIKCWIKTTTKCNTWRKRKEDYSVFVWLTVILVGLFQPNQDNNQSS